MCGDGGATINIPATRGPAVLTCTDPSTCKNVTFKCQGNYACTLVCSTDGGAYPCEGSTLECADGPCTLSCGMMACGGPLPDGGAAPVPTAIDCGPNSCNVTYFGPDFSSSGMAPVTQDCDASCDCTHSAGPGGP
jgi:hypothetical protein